MTALSNVRADQPPHAVDILGAALHAGDVLVEHRADGTEAPHRIDHFNEYPGRFIGAGDHARRVFCSDGWRCTAADWEHFHVQIT